MMINIIHRNGPNVSIDRTALNATIRPIVSWFVFSPYGASFSQTAGIKKNSCLGSPPGASLDRTENPIFPPKHNHFITITSDSSTSSIRPNLSFSHKIRPRLLIPDMHHTVSQRTTSVRSFRPTTNRNAVH